MRSNLEDALSSRLLMHASKFTTGRLGDVNTTLTFEHPTILTMVPTAARDLTMPDDDDITKYGAFFIVRNASAGAFAITVKDEAAATLGDIAQNETGIIYLDNLGVWRVCVGTTT